MVISRGFGIAWLVVICMSVEFIVDGTCIFMKLVVSVLGWSACIVSFAESHFVRVASSTERVMVPDS